MVIIGLTISQLLPAQEKNINDSILQLLDHDIKDTPIRQMKQLDVSEEEVVKMVDSWPAFSVFKDTYFVTGVPLNRKINRNSADALFQISIRHRITRSRLPLNTFLYLTYTQKSFWNIYAKSSPFLDNNYNPCLGLGRYIIQNGKLKGTAFLQLEHESNGKDSIESRSWNMLSMSVKYFFNPRVIFAGKAWIPYVDGDENSDLLDYRGFFTASLDYISGDQKWWLTAEINPRKGFGNMNTTVTAAFRTTKNANQYFYARLFNGMGENLLDYDRYSFNLRVGFCIKPSIRGAF
ncbi:MAG: hypothetical protein H6Q14_2547 [Bacteroidetes bacterium]|nr:hypothetical protein [Bacteroidota bacterium]